MNSTLTSKSVKPKRDRTEISFFASQLTDKTARYGILFHSHKIQFLGNIMDSFIKYFSSFMSSSEIINLYDSLLQAYENETEFIRSIVNTDEYLSIYASRNQELSNTKIVYF